MESKRDGEEKEDLTANREREQGTLKRLIQFVQ